MLVKLAELLFWTIAIPCGLGFALQGLLLPKTGQGVTRLLWLFAGGYMWGWALFQVVTVPFVLLRESFFDVSVCYGILTVLISMFGLVRFRREIRDSFAGVRASCRQCSVKESVKLKVKLIFEDKAALLFWCAFAVLLLFQLYMSYHLRYADGDDAYYVSISSAANLGGTMYQMDAYSGAPTTLDMRHGLAPFPIWISFVARKMGVHAAVAAHTWVPLVLIPLTYVLYALLGKELLGNGVSEKGASREKTEGKAGKIGLPLFLSFAALLQIFGNYSIYPASTFLLTRTRQGKAALGNIILPFLLLLLLQIGKRVKEEGRASLQQVMTLMAVVTAGCLCTTMSAFLLAMLALTAAGILMICYRKWLVLAQVLAGCLPGFAMAALYVLLR